MYGPHNLGQFSLRLGPGRFACQAAYGLLTNGSLTAEAQLPAQWSSQPPGEGALRHVRRRKGRSFPLARCLGTAECCRADQNRNTVRDGPRPLAGSGTPGPPPRHSAPDRTECRLPRPAGQIERCPLPRRRRLPGGIPLHPPRCGCRRWQ